MIANNRFRLFVLAAAASLICLVQACCTGGDCGDSLPVFSVGFVNPDGNYHYFDETEVVDLKIFYGDSTYIKLNQNMHSEGDSVFYRFFAYPDLNIQEYAIMANDTLMGILNIRFDEKEDKCCGTSFEVNIIEFESSLAYSTEFGFNIIL